MSMKKKHFFFVGTDGQKALKEVSEILKTLKNEPWMTKHIRQPCLSLVMSYIIVSRIFYLQVGTRL